MQNKKTFLSLILFATLFCITGARGADSVADAVLEQQEIADQMEAVSADAVAAYDPTGSLFQQITDLEQEKVLMELEKERAQLDLELDRLAAEKIKLHMEIDTLSGRAEQQQQELENAQAELEAQAARLEREKEALQAQTEELQARQYSAPVYNTATDATVTNAVSFDSQYKLVNVIGAGSQLQATIANLATGQKRTVSVGKVIDGYTVQSISLDEGIVFTNGEDTQTLNIVKSN